MKQIFDWLREQIAEDDSMGGIDVNWAIPKWRVLKIIDEAEAKWEAECCEWKRIESSEFDYMDSKHGFLEEYTTGWKFCPYCGKPIKISEVE